MKHCPVCTLDYSDEFSYCEFDGAILQTVAAEVSGLSRFARFKLSRKALRLTAFAVVIALVSLFIFARTIPTRKTSAQRITEIAAVDSSPYFQTPQAAQDFVEASESAASDAQEKAAQRNSGAEKPGVTVTLPEAKPSNQAPTTEPPQPLGEAEAATVPTPVRSSKNPPALPPAPPTTQPATHSAPRATKPQVATNRANRNDELAELAPAGNGAVNLNLVRLRSFRTDTGVRYDLTFNMQQHEGRVVRWERLNLLTHSQSGISHSEVVPFYQRLGSSGSMSFTVSVEMRGSSQADWQGRITCTGVGTDVEGRYVKTNFTARVNP
ncbi:MAG: hypothetical protein HY231_10145 [Acidobacteria bacterium]|nr:hypothetical protein [Acidobacteriota bacterium]